MKILHQLQLVSPRPKQLAIGIGNFDGVHLGHQELLRRLKKLAGRSGQSGVITFIPHTRRTGEQGDELLTTLDQRLELISAGGIDLCWVVNLGEGLSGLSPRSFISDIIVEELGASDLCVGFDYHFGRDRGGNTELLKKLASEFDFRLEVVPPVMVEDKKVSSSLIRQLVRAGKVGLAHSYLGRDHILTGTVIKGEGLGAKIGWPTANFVPGQLPPAPGVYAATVEFGEGCFGGLFYRGPRPTVSELNQVGHEVHILDWSGDIYGREIKVCLKKRLRDDIKFNSVEVLVKQLQTDKSRAGEILAGMGISQEE